MLIALAQIKTTVFTKGVPERTLTEKSLSFETFIFIERTKRSA